MKKVEEGQILYVSTSGMFTQVKPNLKEYIVTRFNKSSFYARPADGEREIRFNRKTWTHDGGIGYQDKAYETAEEYWRLVELTEERNQLREDLRKSINSSSLKQLREINKIVNS